MSELPQEKVPNPLWRAVKHYGYGCFAKAWNGAIVSAWAFIGQTTGFAFDTAHFSQPDWHTLAYTFAVVFSVQVLGYFKDNPLPEKLPESTPPFATTTKIDHGQITTTPVSPVTEKPAPFPEVPKI